MNNDNTWLVALSAGHWQLSGIRAAMRQGLQVLALDGDPDASGLGLSTQAQAVDIKDPDLVLASIQESGIEPSGVVSFVSEVGMPAAAVIREKFGLPGPDYELTRRLTNKIAQRQVWQQKGVPGPEWWSFSSMDEAIRQQGAISYPCIVKPADSAGSRGVTKVESAEEYLQAAELALSTSRSGEALVESFMDGVEYAVETFGDGNKTYVLAVTEKKKVPGTRGTVARELATLNDPVREQLVADVAVKALDALGYTSGPGHTEVIVQNTDGSPGLIEAAGRGGGFMVFERMIEMATGFDIVTATALQAVGVDAEIELGEKQAVVLRFVASTQGEVSKVSGIDAANSITGVEAGAFVKVGDKVREVEGDGDRLAYILAVDETPEKAARLADQAESVIQIDLI